MNSLPTIGADYLFSHSDDWNSTSRHRLTTRTRMRVLAVHEPFVKPLMGAGYSVTVQELHDSGNVVRYSEPFVCPAYCLKAPWDEGVQTFAAITVKIDAGLRRLAAALQD